MLEEDLIEADFDDLSDAEILVMLLIPDGMVVSRTRLQYLAFLYRALYEKKKRPEGLRGLIASHDRVSDTDHYGRNKKYWDDVDY